MTGKALIVDDEESVRFFAASGLSQIGWQVDEASSGETALNLLEHNPFDILFLDLHMTGIDGLTVMRRVRKRWPEVKIIIITAYASVESAVEAVRQGAFDYLRKPCSIDDIIASANRALVAKKSGSLTQPVKTHPTATEEITSTSALAVQTGSLLIEFGSRTASLAGQRLSLTPTEYKLLEILAHSPGQPVSLEQLIQQGLGYNTDDIHTRETLRVHISRLRHKLKGNYIRTIRGDGYLLADIPPA